MKKIVASEDSGKGKQVIDIKEIARETFYTLFRIMIRRRWYDFLAFIYSFTIEEVSADGRVCRHIIRKNDEKFTILALTPHAFRKDIECIAKTNEIRVLKMQNHWQALINYQFYPNKLKKVGLKNNPADPNYKYKKERNELRAFLEKFLPVLYKKFKIDCVISPHCRYMVDIDWGAVSSRIGVPYILIPRDSQLASSLFLRKSMHILLNVIPRFEGDHIIVQSELDKPIYIESDYVSPERISSLGCPRMDDFVKGIQLKPVAKKNRKKKVVFLPIMFNQSLPETDFFPYIKEVHTFFIKFAIKHPEIDVVIKPKPKCFLPWKNNILSKFLEGTDEKLKGISNLTLRGDIDVHDLFIEGDVICGLNTSALLEAAVIGKPVIFPYFKELHDPRCDERIFYREYFHLFDIAKTAEELESIILYRLHNPTIDEEIMAGRKDLFEKYISSMKGDATEKHVALIKGVVARNKTNIK